ncbi:MAG TPA: carboxymuconolactone decarboxylase family protein [Acidimicrobiales bacterium]|nr:carboxymuconolactone decarboxylase family protein [Acidimicrobiales bacterium]
MSEDKLRIEPLALKQWPEEMRDAMAALRPPQARHSVPDGSGDRPKALNALGTFARYPALARAFNTFNGHVLYANTLSERERELLVLRVACLRRCTYEWAQHSVIAAHSGLTQGEIGRVEEGPEAAGWLPLEKAMLKAVDELVSDAVISDDTWTALASELDERQMMDLVFTVGAYDALAMAFRSFGVQLDADLRK